jgi:hypothetical protein
MSSIFDRSNIALGCLVAPPTAPRLVICECKGGEERSGDQQSGNGRCKPHVWFPSSRVRGMRACPIYNCRLERSMPSDGAGMSVLLLITTGLFRRREMT